MIAVKNRDIKRKNGKILRVLRVFAVRCFHSSYVRDSDIGGTDCGFGKCADL